MGIDHSVTPIHWNYFLALEDDLVRLARYVELSKKNEDTYSIEIARLFMSASAEVDAVLKQLVKKNNPSSKAASINAYYKEITTNYQNFTNFNVLVRRHGLKLTPWTNWSDNTPPIWWQDHNKVKHHRHTDFEKATIKNCLNALAALFVSVIHLYAEADGKGQLLMLPSLFHLGESHIAGTTMNRFGHSFSYDLSQNLTAHPPTNHHPLSLVRASGYCHRHNAHSSK